MPVASARYDAVAMTLHWVIAALILFDFVCALSFSQFNPGDALFVPSAYALHMSTGLAVLVLSIVRALWRLTHRAPRHPEMGVALRTLARSSHLLLYVFMVAAPATGWLVLSLRHQATSVFGLFSWGWPTVPAVATMAHAERELYQGQLLALHSRLSYLGMSLVVLHFAAAFYHHLYRRDDILRRMLPRTGGALRAPRPPALQGRP
jgi:cytochrome b561